MSAKPPVLQGMFQPFSNCSDPTLSMHEPNRALAEASLSNYGENMSTSEPRLWIFN